MLHGVYYNKSLLRKYISILGALLYNNAINYKEVEQ